MHVDTVQHSMYISSRVTDKGNSIFTGQQSAVLVQVLVALTGGPPNPTRVPALLYSIQEQRRPKLAC